MSVSISQQAMAIVKYHKMSHENLGPIATLGKFTISQTVTALVMVVALIESVVTLAFMFISLLLAPCTTRPCKFFASLWKSSSFTVFEALTEFLTFRADSLYSAPERLVRAAILQYGVGRDGCLESSLFSIFGFLCCTGQVNQTRIQQNRDTFGLIDVRGDFLEPLDGKARIDVFSLTYVQLKQKIETLGGKWERLDKVFAITPPEVPIHNENWLRLCSVFDHLQWKRETMDGKERYITCANADVIPDGKIGKECFIQVNNPNTTYMMAIRKMGFYLGCMQNICFFDQRGRGNSSGIASEGGFNSDLLSVYQHVNKSFATANIWVGGLCGSCPTVAYLRKKEPVNIIFEAGFSDLNDHFIETQDPLSRSMARHFMDGIRARDFAPEVGSENGFSIRKHWQGAQKSAAKAIVVTVSNDNYLKAEVATENIQLASQVSERPTHVQFHSVRDNTHSDSFLHYEEPTREVTQAIFA